MLRLLPPVQLRNPSVALTALALACSSAPRVEPHSAVEPSAPAAPPGSGVATQAPTGHGTPPQPERCDSVGPMACSMPVSSHANLCANVSACVKKALTEDEASFADFAIECSFMNEHDAESAYSRPSPALAESGVQSTALLKLTALDQDGFTQFGAAYLVADFAAGSCLVDLVHPWNRPSIIADTTFATVWTPTAQGHRVEVRSREILHEALDSSELAAGESDVRSDYCTRLVYDVMGGRFRRVSRDSTEGSCGDD